VWTDSIEFVGSTTLNGPTFIATYRQGLTLDGPVSGTGASLTLVDGWDSMPLTLAGNGSTYDGGTTVSANMILNVTSTDGQGLGTGNVTILGNFGVTGGQYNTGGTLNLNGVNAVNVPTMTITNDGYFSVGAGASAVVGDVVPGAVTVIGDPNFIYNRTTTVGDNASLSVNSIVQNTVSVGANATLAIRSGAAKTTSVVNTLTIAGPANALTGKVDIGKNYLVVTAPGQLVAVNAMVANATNYNNSPNYGWDGNGITSSLAAADSSGTLSIGVGNADDEGLTGTLVGNHVLAATDTLVLLTISGDADLNGIVNVDDYNTLRGFYGQTNATWEMGDFNYDGVVNADDYNTLRGFYNQSSPLAPDLTGAAGAVPEPATMVLLALGAVALLKRRTNRA
jgi:hypothetical protein